MKFGLFFLLSFVSLQAELKPRIDPLLLDLRQSAHCNQYSRDIDGDGDEDILFLTQDTQTSADDLSIYLEKQDDGTYSDAKFFAAPRAGESVSAHDLNGDGRLDPIILFRESSQPFSSTYRFGARWHPSLPSGGYADAAIVSAFPSINNDEKFSFTDDGSNPFLLRVRPTNRLGSTTELSITHLLPGENFGTVEKSNIDLPAGLEDPEISQALWGNFDNTGNPDLLLYQRSGSSTLIWLLPSDSSFVENAEPLFTFSHSGEVIRVDDLNQDGLDDLWVPLTTGGFHYALRNSSGDSFLPSVTQAIPMLANSIPLGWAMEARDATTPSLTYFSFSGGNPTTTQSLLTTQFGDWTVQSTPTDFAEHHQEPNVFSPFLKPFNQSPLLLSGTSAQPGVTLLSGFSIQGASNEYFGAPNRYAGERLSLAQWTPTLPDVSFALITPAPLNTADDYHRFLYPADFNQDGLVDLIVGPDTDEKFWLRLNEGDAQFTDGQALKLLPPSFLAASPNLAVSGFTVGDIDQDGDPDLVVSYLDSDRFDQNNDRAICLSGLNDGNGSFSLPTSLPAPFAAGYLSRSCATLALIDWDSDGDLDIIDSSIGWRENKGHGDFSTTSRFLVPPGILGSDMFGNPVTVATDVSFGDVNGDGNIDILTSLFAIESEGQRYAIDPATGTLVPIPENVYGSNSTGQSLAAVLLTDEMRRITQTIPIPLSLATSDALGNPISVGPTFLSDLDLDGLHDIVTIIPASDSFGNPTSIGSRWIRSRGGEDPFPLTDFNIVATIPGIGGPLRDFDGNGTLEHSTPYNFVSPSLYGPEYSPIYDFIGPRYELSSSGIMEDFDNDGDLDSIYQHQGYNFSTESYETYFIVRNQIIDETSGVTFAMRELGILGADANPASDPDDDGKSNFEELILGCDPQVADNSDDFTRTFPTLTPSLDLQFSVNKRAKAAGVTYRIEYSADMNQWQPAEAAYLEDEDSIWETWQFIPNDIPSCFFRLVIEP